MLFLQVKAHEDNLLVLERSYPRRQHYSVITNLGDSPINNDLSYIYWGGHIVTSSSFVTGYHRFTNTIVHPKDTFVFRLEL